MTEKTSSDTDLPDPVAERRWNALEETGISGAEIRRIMKEEGFTFPGQPQTEKPFASRREATDHAYKEAVDASRRIFTEAHEVNSQRIRSIEANSDSKVQEVLQESPIDSSSSEK